MNRELICLAVICMASLAATSSFSANLLAQFDFNDKVGNTSGTSFSGSAIGIMAGNAGFYGSTVAPANGAGSKSLAIFDGVNSSAAGFNTSAVFSDLESFTLAGWIRLTSTGGRIMSTGGGYSEGGFDLYLANGKLMMRVDGMGPSATANTAQAVGSWSYFAVTYDGTKTGANVRYYIGDGTTLMENGLASLNVGVVDDSSLRLSIGNNPTIFRNMNGGIDNVRVWGGMGTSGIASVAELTAAMQYDDMFSDMNELETASILFEDFEQSNGLTAGSLDGQNGWRVSRGLVDVQSSVVHTSGVQTVEMADGSSITHSLTNNGNTLWMRFLARISELPLSNPSTPLPNTSVAFYVNTNGTIVVYSGNTPQTTSITMPINSWVQFDIYCDYDDANPNNWWWSLSMNGTYVGDMYVYSTNSTLETIQFISSSESYVDQIDISDHEQVAGAPDFDGDGIPDWWEIKYFLDKDALIASSPSPTPGLTYLQAYIAGVSPLVYDPFILQQTASNALHWTSLPGRLYDVEWTSNLASNFITIAADLPWPIEAYTDNDHSSEAAGFYRLKVDM